MAGSKSNGVLKPSASKGNAGLAKSTKAAKFTETAPVTENENSEVTSRTPSPTSSNDKASHIQSTPIPQPKSRKVRAPKPAAGGFLKITRNPTDGYSDREPRRKTGDPGVAVPYKSPKNIKKGFPAESRALWWKQTDEWAHRWGGSDEGEEDMDWVNQYYPKKHWKTRRALAEKEAVMEGDGNDQGSEEGEIVEEGRGGGKKSRG